MIMIWIIFYLLGVLLSVGRHLAIDYEWYELQAKVIPPRRPCIKHYQEWEMAMHLLSWFTFIILVLVYFQEHNKYFLKFTFKKIL